MAVILIAAAVFAAPKSAQMVMSMKAEVSPDVIVIDAGHGGSQLRKIIRKAAAVPGKKTTVLMTKNRNPRWQLLSRQRGFTFM